MQYRTYILLKEFNKHYSFDQTLKIISSIFKIDINTFFKNLIKNKKVTLLYLNYFKNNEITNDFILDIKNIYNFIKNSENFKDNETINIVLFLLSFSIDFEKLLSYIKNYFINIDIHTCLINYKQVNIKINAYIFNYKLCYESMNEDSNLFINKNICMNFEVYEYLFNQIELLESLTDDKSLLSCINKIKKIFDS